MKYIHIKKFSLGCLVAFFVMAMNSCINEDLDPCPVVVKNTLTLQVVNINGDDITKLAEVTQGSLLAFSENGQLVDRQELSHDQLVNKAEITFNIDYKGKMYIVCWGNVRGVQETIGKVKELKDPEILLNQDENAVAQSPDKLFYGNKEITLGEAGIDGGNQVITISPKTATIKIETRGVDNALKWNNLKSTPDPLKFYMDNSLSGFDYAGKMIGSKVRFQPEGQYAVPANWTLQEWVTKNDATVAPGENLKFSLYYSDLLIGAVSEGVNIDTGETGPFKTYEGKRTYVIISFGQEGTVSAKMKITPWGVVDDDIEWGK